MKSIACLLLISAIAGLIGMGCGEDTPGDDRIGVIVTIPPQAEFVEAVGGDRVEVEVMVPSGADPHTYEVTPGQMKKAARAALYAQVGSGVEFELAWADKLISLNRDMLVVDCSKGITLIEGLEDDEHGGTMDPHVWMSPRNAITMVKNICIGLITVDPENRSYYESNRDAYIAQLEALDQGIREELSDLRSRTFMVYHPAFGYFAHEYDLTMLSIEEEGKEPTAGALARLIETAKAVGIRAIFIEPQFSPRSAEVIAKEIGAEVITIDPLGRNYLENMQELAGALIAALK